MAFNVSPGVYIQEKDATTIVPSIATTAGGLSGTFQWGPAEVVRYISTEQQLASTFWKPNGDTAVSFFTAANFLSYGQNLGVVRVVGPAARNATSTGTGTLIKNRDIYDAQYAHGEGTVGSFAAKYAGVLGNALKVSMADSNTYSKALAGTVTTTSGAKSVVGSGTTFTADLVSGSELRNASTGAVIGIVDIISSDTSLSLRANANANVSGLSVIARWEFASLFQTAPGTSDYAKSRGGLNDEVHVVVVDSTGVFTGTAGTVVEKFAYASVATDAKQDNGATNYYVNLINDASAYVYWMDHPVATVNWGTSVVNKTFSPLAKPESTLLSGGVSDDILTDSIVQTGLALFANDEAVDVALLMMGAASSVSAVYAINNVAETRKDCVVFLSPALTDVLNAVGTEADKILALRNTLPSTSYAHLDSGWKYQYDRYNDVYRWIPLNGDMAGIYARTDQTNDPWFSGAGFNRGQVKNVVKLAYSPSKTDRDRLYVAGVNPVVSFAGEGTILYGDKTLLAKPGSFDRMNVRRLFITLEKSIATAAKFQLFEFNDPFTRAQFKSYVEPFLRDVKGRRGITDFYVQCDESNNDGEVIDGNRFRGSIFVKAARSINFIELQFVSTPTGMDFSEVVGI